MPKYPKLTNPSEKYGIETLVKEPCWDITKKWPDPTGFIGHKERGTKNSKTPSS